MNCFTLVDLFHDNAPHLSARYDWSDAHFDRGASEADGKKPWLCRCVGQMEKKDRKWVFVVFKMEAVSWADVDYVAGIYAS